MSSRLEKSSVAAAITRIETNPFAQQVTSELDQALAAGGGQVIGLTGPPGVGKSTLTQVLVQQWIAMGKRTAVLAIDPSSQRSGGALLGDRTRMNLSSFGEMAFIRSMAAGDRLGGLSSATYPASVLLSHHFDRVVVETVGVGQSEMDIQNVADVTILCLQPGSGDSLQYMKSGIAEIPDVVLVTKSDTGLAAKRTLADMRGALSLRPREMNAEESHAAVLSVSAKTGEGVADAVEAIEARLTKLGARRAEKFAAYAQVCLSALGGRLAVQCVQNHGMPQGFAELASTLERLTVSMGERQASTHENQRR